MSKLTFTDDAGNSQDMALPPGIALTVAPPVKIAFAFAQLKGLVGRVTNQSTIPSGGACTVLWGAGKASSILGPHATTSFTYPAAGPYTVTVQYKAADGTITSATQDVVIVSDASTLPPPVVVNPPPANPPPVTADPPAAQSGSGNVYADALAGLALPVKSPWSTTRPAYTAQASMTLTDNTVLTCDTSKQVPDYVPYAGMWYYPFLLPDGSRHPDLYLDCYADGVKISNMMADALANYAGHHTIKINDVVVEDTDDTYAFGTSTVPCRTGLPQATPTRNWDPKMVPNYGKIPGGYTPFTAQLAAADNSPTGRSLTTPYDGMGTQGAQYSIGILHGAMVPWVVDGGDANWTVVRTIEDHAWRWPVALRDRVTGLPAYNCIPHCQDVSILPNCPNAAGHFNPVKTTEKSPLQADPAHTPRFGVVGYISTGSMIDLEATLMWGAYACYWGNPQDSGYQQCISYEQTRGIAWDNLQKAYAAKLCPADHPLHDMLQTVVANNAAALDALYGTSGTNKNQFGIFAHGFQYPTSLGAGFSPFQQDYLAASTHQIIDLGFSGWDGVASYLDTFTAGRMGDGTTGLFWTTASFYTMAPLVSGNTSVNPPQSAFVADWTTFNNQNLTIHGHASEIGKTVDQADVGAGPGQPNALSGTPTNYWANLQGPLASLGSSHPAWQLFASKILPSQNYATGGQFNILPRA